MMLHAYFIVNRVWHVIHGFKRVIINKPEFIDSLDEEHLAVTVKFRSIGSIVFLMDVL